MATIVSLNLDVQHVRRALSGSSRAIDCESAADAATLLARLGAGVPDLVVLGGDAALAADAAEALLDEPRLFATPILAWMTRGTIADTSRLLALGAQVVEGDANAFRTVCGESLDAREGRTIRVDAETELQPSGDGTLDLHGRRVLVADDDPAITWYFADLLRTRGCDVEEASDGEAALDRARRTVPDLIVSDIRMPRMDGIRLCRALRVDPILADVPVVLLSWKEDWLSRAEESGAEAAAYLGKRSTPEEILGCVAEALALHKRLEQRLRDPGSVRGRLDGTAPYRLLRLACAARPDARLTLQCNPRGYEVRIRGSAPRSAVRLDRDGAMLRGAPALVSLLQERAGRFTLQSEQAPIEADLSGSLHQQIASCVASARRGLDAAKAPPPSQPAPVAPMPAVVVPAAALAPVVQAAPLSQPAMPVATLPMAPRSLVVRAPAPAPRVPERTLPLARPEARRPVPVVRTGASPARRSWKGSLRWVGVAVVAALGLVLGAGVRALRQPPAPPPTVSAR
jgi:CheY-like chemotaxis protein